MHLRLPFWLAILAFATAAIVRGQSTAPARAMPPGQIIAKQVTGRVSMVLNGVSTDLKNNDAVSSSATVVTANGSSVILVFSNGATTQLGADTTLVIEEFLQDPFQQTVALADLSDEPTTSRTKLHLTKGELVGKVAHLKHDQGSYFTVQTPVGAAGIRGTTFRIVFRPTGTGQAFALFSLSTVEGNVNFQSGAGAGQPPAAPAHVQGQGAGPGGGSGQPANGVAVTGGQEVVVTISVNVNQQTGQVSVSAPPAITSTQPIAIETQALIVQQAQTLVTTAATTTFTPPPPAPVAPPSTTSGDSQPQSGTQQQSTGSGNQSSNQGSSSDSAANPPATPPAATPSTSTGSTAPRPQLPAAPPVTTPTPNVTPLTGKGPG